MRPVYTERPVDFDAQVELEKALIAERGFVRFVAERGQRIQIDVGASEPSAYAALGVCVACGAQKTRESDGFCGGCGARPNGGVQ